MRQTACAWHLQFGCVAVTASALGFIPHPIHPQITAQPIVRQNLGLVHHAAKKFHAKDPMVGYDDMIQVGTISMYDAIYKFDSTRGVSFSTFAYTCIRRSMSRLCNRKMVRCTPLHSVEFALCATRKNRNRLSDPELYVDNLMLLDAVHAGLGAVNISSERLNPPYLPPKMTRVRKTRTFREIRRAFRSE